MATSALEGFGGEERGSGGIALSSPTTEAPYVGVFAGEFVDGLPLYRFPSIQVVGSRRTITPEKEHAARRSAGLA